MKLLIAILANICLSAVAQAAQGPATVTVRTSLGNITGTTHENHARFLGIPFALPPVGPRRFMPPVPVKGYNDLSATEFGSECIQTNFYGETAGEVIGDENCLFLNVFTPEVPSGLLSEVSLKAVMVWIYGGAFTQGSSNEYTVPMDLLQEDVVVVTINYRVGVFGFLTFGNELVSGNQGLRDQILALEWVQDHIHNFGGDKSRVTIFGESAGGVSVHALQMSPLAAGLFSGAIAQSGTMFMTKVSAAKSQDWRTARAFAEIFNCNSLDYKTSMLLCLQEVAPATLQTTTSITDYSIDETDLKFDWASPWPAQDYYSSNPVLPLDPLEAMVRGQFNKVPIMTGAVQHEGALSLIYAQVAEDKEKWWRVLGPIFLQMTQSSNRSEVTDSERLKADAILQFYAQGNVDSVENPEGWELMFQDTGFLSPDQKFAELSSRHVDVFNYFYTHHTNHSLAPLYGYEDSRWSPIHADDVLFLFNTTFLQSPKSVEDDLMTRIMTKYWTNFAKFRTPSPQKIQSDEETSTLTSVEETTSPTEETEGELDLPEWKPFSTKKLYMDLSTSPTMEADNAPTRMYFMQKVFWDKRENEIQRTLLLEEVSKSILTFVN